MWRWTEDNDVQSYYGVIGAVGYGLTDAVELYVPLGIADVEAKMKSSKHSDYLSGIDFDNDFARGWGTRYTFYERHNLNWGAMLQMKWIYIKATSCLLVLVPLLIRATGGGVSGLSITCKKEI
jgi:hypothetical protein